MGNEIPIGPLLTSVDDPQPSIAEPAQWGEAHRASSTKKYGVQRRGKEHEDGGLEDQHADDATQQVEGSGPLLIGGGRSPSVVPPYRQAREDAAMRVVLQRVHEAEVTVAEVSVGGIDRGIVVLAGLAYGDDEADVVWMARKIASLRVFGDDGAPNRKSVVEVGAAVLAISQFTLVADCRKGRRPSYDRAMAGEAAGGLFERFIAALRTEIAEVATGRFGATMHVRLVNDGPYTLVIDSPARDRRDDGRVETF